MAAAVILGPLGEVEAAAAKKEGAYILEGIQDVWRGGAEDISWTALSTWPEEHEA